MIDPKYETALVKAFRDLHDCKADHVETVPVIETYKGQTVWEGDVEVFSLEGHPKAAWGYAWAFDKGAGSEIVAVLELPPVISPKTAIQAFVVSKIKEIERN